MKDNNKISALLSFATIIYSTYGLFTDDGSRGTYIGAIILSSIILFLSLNLLMLNRFEKKHQ